MARLKSTIKAVNRQRFNIGSKHAKGSMARGALTSMELHNFLRAVSTEKLRLLFKCQALLGLRPGVVTRLNISNFDFKKRQLVIVGPDGAPSAIRLPPELSDETASFVQRYKDRIAEADGFLFFKDHGSANREPYLSKDYARNAFRSAMRKANMGAIYDYTKESLPQRKMRALHKFTMKSLYNYAKRRFYKDTEFV